MQSGAGWGARPPARATPKQAWTSGALALVARGKQAPALRPFQNPARRRCAHNRLKALAPEFPKLATTYPYTRST